MHNLSHYFGLIGYALSITILLPAIAFLAQLYIWMDEANKQECDK